MYKKWNYIKIFILLAIFAAVANLDIIKKINVSNKGLIDPLSKKDREEKSEELNPKIYEYIQMMRIPIGTEENDQIKEKTTIYEEHQKALKRRKRSLSKLNASQRRMFSRIEGGNGPIGIGKKRLKKSNVNWASRGPGNVPGRTREIVVMPNDPGGNTWLIGTVSGGVWKTTNAGATWKNLTSDIPLLATSYLTVSEANPNVIYVGIGEQFAYTSNLFGSGIFKSTNGGETWTRTPGSENLGQMSRMVSDPGDENVVVVATNKGLKRTIDGGQSWADVSPTGTEDYFFQDLKASESDFNIQYAFSKNIDKANEQGIGKIYKSTDGGATWMSLGKFPDINFLVRTELAISRTDPDRVYASISIDQSTSRLGVSTDGGASWTYLRESGYTPFFNFLTIQGEYNNTIMVHPFNDDIVYVGGFQLYRYEVTRLGDPSATLFSRAVRVDVSTPFDQGRNDNVHVDHHNLKAILGQGRKFRIINANDGGISVTDEDKNPGVKEGSWNNTNAFSSQEGSGSLGFDAMRGIVSSQFYAATKVNGKNRYIGGMQDNGSYISPLIGNTNQSSDYKAVSAGDGFTCLINYKNSNEILTTSQYNTVYYSSNGGATIKKTSNSFRGDSKSPFFSWIANSNQRPRRVFSAHTYGVEVSSNFGQTWRLTPITETTWRDYASRNVRVAVNDYDPNVVIAATTAGNFDGVQFPIHVSTNGGKTFNPKVINIDAGSAFFVQALNTSPTNSHVIYVGNSIRDSEVGKLFRSKDMGNTWEDLSGFSQGVDKGFPDAAVFDVIEMPYNDQIIWASTDIGIVCSVNGGESWTLLDTDLPAVVVWDMQIVNDQVVLATFGRGIWSVTIPELARANVSPINSDVNVHQKLDAKQQIIDGDMRANIFPNPFRNSLTIRVNEKQTGQIGVLIYNQWGQIVFKGNFQKRGAFLQEKIDLSHLTPGFYSITISTPKGTKRYKIIKQIE